MLPTTASLLLVLLASPAAPPQQEPLGDVEIPEGIVERSGEYITLNLSEQDEKGLSLRQFIKVAQVVTGRNFTLDESTGTTIRTKLDQRKLLLYGPKRIRLDDFYSFFQIMMKINGFVCIQQGSGELAVVVITEQLTSNNALIKANAPFVEVENVPDFADHPGTYIYTVVPLQYANAQDLATNLRTALSSQAGDTSAFMPLQEERALLVQGYGPFVAAAVRMIRRIDVEPEEVEVHYRKVPLREQDAKEMAQVLQDLIEELTVPQTTGNRRGGQAPLAQNEPKTTIVAYEPDNSLIITGTDENIEKILDLVAQLDSRVELQQSTYHVYTLQYLAASEIEESLTDFIESSDEAVRQARQDRPGGQESRGLSDQKVVIQMDAATNSVLVMATRSKWNEIRELLDRLDQRQPQVLLETALIEISEDFQRDIGFEYAKVETPVGDTQKGFVFTSVGITTAENIGDARLPSPTAAGLTYGIFDGEDLGIPFIVQAAQNSSNANVLSVPSVLVSNNKRAKIESKDEVPYQTSNAVQAAVSTNFEFAEAGITLSITPSISAQKYLRLYISLEVSSFRGDGQNGGPPPSTSRTIETTVTLPDGATMWLGGIIRDDQLESERGIPFLSDIPILGPLFGSTSKQNVKTTLFFFCTPRIIEDFDELADVSDRGKAHAASTIGLERVHVIDPDFQMERPDLILEEDVNGDGRGGDGATLDLGGFAAPAYEPNGGEVPPDEVGLDRAAPFREDG